MSARVLPPEAAREEWWHWLVRGGVLYAPAEWVQSVDRWIIGGKDVRPAEAYDLGWRYHAPALIPPAAVMDGE